MAGAVYQVVTGSSTTLPVSMSLLSLDGWLIFGSVNQSGSVFSVLMGKGTGYPLPLTDLTQSLVSGSGAITGMWQNVFPPQTATDTLLGINTNPNKISVRS